MILNRLRCNGINTHRSSGGQLGGPRAGIQRFLEALFTRITPAQLSIDPKRNLKKLSLVIEAQPASGRSRDSAVGFI
jgi:hypothetical protein